MSNTTSINPFHKYSSFNCVDYNTYKTCISICISNDNYVYSCGSSLYGSHGHKENNIYSFTKINTLKNIKMISCGYFHTLCLDYDGNVFTFGDNDHGQLGIGKNKEELSHLYSPSKLDLPPIRLISCGIEFSTCLSETNELYTFGSNQYGQLGLGCKTYYNSPQLIPDFNNINFYICGNTFVICKTYDNEYYSWGYNDYGQLGHGNYTNSNKPIQCLNWPDNIISIKSASRHSLLLSSEGQVYTLGDNEYGQLGINDKKIQKLFIPILVEDIPEIQSIDCGTFHSTCIDINNNLWVFGRNGFGQLGIENAGNIYKPILLSTLSNIVDISSKGHHTFVKTIDDKIYAFGYNSHSQLGIETKEEYQKNPIQVLQGQEDIWCSIIGKSRAKSARK